MYFKRDALPNFFIISGLILVIVSLTILILTFYPVAKIELNYEINYASQAQKETDPVDTEFGVVIPKIGANSHIVEDVSPYDEYEYQRQLTKGVAHAKGTSVPGEAGNIFLFSHSAANFFEAGKYNAIFYLLGKMVLGDEIVLYYKNNKFTYKVTDKRVVGAQDVQYLKGDLSKKTVTLMTCTPPGTTFKRLLVIGELEESAE